ncbi:hypothetical protein [Urbifossiella limnaea]|uniref:Uncharacterized protein n=1 Tax=Urbifossiella limnaea TaxID=2528023 RepID=A0A517XSE6_9BACT|nr:hypothetical protein [Urbifossiella limnaea]QDU20430.1 hypothetical protein ETAA1_23820 [Urbifossiella limnaea]
MDHALLRSWLELPAGEWPPEPHVLLGNPADPADAETRALDRMDRLRPYQLLHPELVTEGMTRLAQALIAFSEAPPRYEFVEPLQPARPPATFEVVEELPPPAEVLPLAEDLPAGRRWVYARLAVVRRLIRAWDRVGVVFGDPDDPADTPVRVMVLLEAVRTVRPLLPGVKGVMGGVGEPGGVCAALVRQPLILDTFRRFLPDQRVALAADWRRGRDAVRREYAWLRRVSAQGRAHRAGRRGVRAAWRWALHTPELLLVPLLLILLVVRLRGN